MHILICACDVHLVCIHDVWNGCTSTVLRNSVEASESVEFAEHGLLVLGLLCPKVCAFSSVFHGYPCHLMDQQYFCNLLYVRCSTIHSTVESGC